MKIALSLMLGGLIGSISTYSYLGSSHEELSFGQRFEIATDIALSNTTDENIKNVTDLQSEIFEQAALFAEANK